MQRPSLLVTDLAGTTVRDPSAIAPALRAALASVGVHVTDDRELAGVRGADKRAGLAALIATHGGDTALAAPALEAFNRRMLDDVGRGLYAPLPGAVALFEAARAGGIRVAATTGFPVAVRDALIAHLGWGGLLDACVAGEEVANGRPAPDLILAAMRQCGISDPSTVANIGDTANDLASGRAANVGWNIAVLTGAHDREQLDARDGDIVVDDLAEAGRVLGIGPACGPVAG